MTETLRKHEDLAGLPRLVRLEIADARRALDGPDPRRAVHEARKAIKRARAIARLLRAHDRETAGLMNAAARRAGHVLAEARKRGEDIGAPDVLGRYQSWRRFDVATLAAATDVFNRLFSSDNPLLRAGRDLGMKLVQAFPEARRGFVREAAGLTGELPELMRG